MRSLCLSAKVCATDMLLTKLTKLINRMGMIRLASDVTDTSVSDDKARKAPPPAPH